MTKLAILFMLFVAAVVLLIKGIKTLFNKIGIWNRNRKSGTFRIVKHGKGKYTYYSIQVYDPNLDSWLKTDGKEYGSIDDATAAETELMETWSKHYVQKVVSTADAKN